MSVSRRWPRALLVFALTLASTAGALVAQPRPAAPPTESPADEGPSHLIYPTQRLPLRFEHSRHLAMPGVTCASCHPAAAASTRVEDSLLPTEASCAPCHAIDREHPASASTAARPMGACDLCHEGWRAEAPLRVARAEVPAANLRFSHARHAAQGVACERCHADVRRVGLATRLELPTMASSLFIVACIKYDAWFDRYTLSRFMRIDTTKLDYVEDLVDLIRFRPDARQGAGRRDLQEIGFSGLSPGTAPTLPFPWAQESPHFDSGSRQIVIKAVVRQGRAGRCPSRRYTGQ